MSIVASCHCGAVKIEVSRMPEQLTECNCSICRKLGALWAYYTTAEATVVSPSEATTSYVWGDHCIAFHHCTTCGCTTHYTGIGEEPIDRVGVNGRMLPLDPTSPVKLVRFDGAESWRRLDWEGCWPW